MAVRVPLKLYFKGESGRRGGFKSSEKQLFCRLTFRLNKKEIWYADMAVRVPLKLHFKGESGRRA